jgi:hypothetical protein
MAEKLTKKQRKTLEALKATFDLGPGYAQILRDAVINDWNEQEIVQAVTSSDTFRSSFPGLLDNEGDLRDFLTGQQNASLNPQNLGSAIIAYKKLWESYQEAAEGYGGITGRIGRDKVALLIRNETSPTELRANLQAVKTVTANAESFRMFNQQLKEMGRAPLDRDGLLRFAVKAAPQELYDVYEATRLRQMDLGLGIQGAGAVARSLGNVDEAGQVTGVAQNRTLAKLVADLKATQADIGPELASAGISSLKLAKFLADPTDDPDLAQRLEQLVTSRRAQGAYVAGTQPRAGAMGPKLSSDAPIASYG